MLERLVRARHGTIPAARHEEDDADQDREHAQQHHGEEDAARHVDVAHAHAHDEREQPHEQQGEDLRLEGQAEAEAEAALQRLHRAQHVQRRGARRAEVEQDADGAAPLRAEVAAEEEVRAAARHAAVGGDGGHGQRGEQRARAAQDDDGGGAQRARLPHDVRQAQEEDDAQDVLQARQEHARQRAQLAAAGLVRGAAAALGSSATLDADFDVLSRGQRPPAAAAASQEAVRLRLNWRRYC